MMGNAGSEIELIKSLELRVLLPEVRKSPEELSKLLAEDFYEVGTSGRLFDRDSIIRALETESDRKLVLTEFQASVLADNVVLTTYRIIRYVENEEVATSRHSSVWKKRDEEWQMVYHQGTFGPKDQ